MKKIQYIAITVLIIGAMAACEKGIHDPNKDNTEPTGVGYYPVSSNVLADTVSKTNLATGAGSPSQFTAGTKIVTELQFFSEGKIKEINQYTTINGTKTKTKTWPYQKAFSQIKKADTLMVDYIIPALAVGTNIRLEHEILNENELKVVRTVFLRVK